MTNQNRAAEIDSLAHSINRVLSALENRQERDRLATEARAKLTEKFGQMDDMALEAKWKGAEDLAQLFREAFHAGKDNRYHMRTIDLVWNAVACSKVDAQRDSPDYIKDSLKIVQEAGVYPEQYLDKIKELDAEYFNLTGKHL